MKDHTTPEANSGKFLHPKETADGSARATVALDNPQTLWFNTGTLCNIECENCYILSSPTNDALVYMSVDEVNDYLDQIEQRRKIAPKKWPVEEIGFRTPNNTAVKEMGAGDVGYLIAGIKDVREARSGETVTTEVNGAEETLDGAGSETAKRSASVARNRIAGAKLLVTRNYVAVAIRMGAKEAGDFGGKTWGEFKTHAPAPLAKAATAVSVYALVAALINPVTAIGFSVATLAALTGKGNATLQKLQNRGAASEADGEAEPGNSEEDNDPGADR